MSSRARKLAKQIELKPKQVSGTKHGCEECRSTAYRQSVARELVTKGMVRKPPPLVCYVCGAVWGVNFGGDSDGNATVSFTVPLLN